MQALGFRLGRRHGNGDSQLEVRSRPTGGAMTSRSSTTAAAAWPPGCGGGLPPRRADPRRDGAAQPGSSGGRQVEPSRVAGGPRGGDRREEVEATPRSAPKT